MAAPTGSLGDTARTFSVSAIAATRDFVAARSPGKRARAEMSKGKFVRPTPKRPARPAIRRRVETTPGAPVVPPALLTPPPERVPLAFLDRPFGSPPMNFAPLAPAPIESALIGPITGPPQLAIGGGVILFQPGGGTSPPGTGILPPPGAGGLVPPGPAIPEPNTWGMMILGFAVLGTAWRRRRPLVKFFIDTGLLRLEDRRSVVLSRP